MSIKTKQAAMFNFVNNLEKLFLLSLKKRYSFGELNREIYYLYEYLTRAEVILSQTTWRSPV